MRVPVTEAEGQLTELVRRTEAGKKITLARHGHAAVRLEPIRTVLDAVQRLAAGKPSEPEAARSQDFLYGEDGLPR